MTFSFCPVCVFVSQQPRVRREGGGGRGVAAVGRGLAGSPLIGGPHCVRCLNSQSGGAEESRTARDRALAFLLTEAREGAAARVPSPTFTDPSMEDSSS